MKHRTWQFFVTLADLTGTRADEWTIQRTDDHYTITFTNPEGHEEHFAGCMLQPGCYRFDAVIIPHDLLPLAIKRLKKLARKKKVKQEKPSLLLSGLQKQILLLKDENLTDEEVAARVHRSKDAVKKQLSRMYEKFHVKHRVGALLKKVRWML